MPVAASAHRPCNSTIHREPRVVRPALKFLGTLAIAAGLSQCGENKPKTSADGIFTAAQADRGDALFGQHCARCHSIQEFTGTSFNTVWADTPASSLYLRIANTMPMDQPGSLGTEQTTALLAHILDSNGMPSGDKPLTGDLSWLTGIQMATAD
mgnify:CR=1 FL=1